MHQLLGHLVRLSVAANRKEPTELGVMIDDLVHRSHLPLESFAQRLWLVISALPQRRTVDVANALVTRRYLGDVIDMLILDRADASPGQTGHELVGRDLDVQRRDDLIVTLGEQPIQRDRLVARPWKAVEDGADHSISLMQALVDDLHGDLIGYQRAGLDEATNLGAEFIIPADRGAKQLPRRDMRESESCGKALRLRPLTRSGCPDHHDDAAHPTPIGWWTFGSRRRHRMKPS